ncbi:MAG: hypothetical protein EBU84_13935 [Actinobacteria bacterium]|nr:hypothetical protein [Actinomycetota bacterium]
MHTFYRHGERAYRGFHGKREKTVNKATNNKATTNKATKVSSVKLSQRVLDGWELVKLGEATALGGWFAIGDALRTGARGMQAQFVEVSGYSKSLVSKAVTIAEAQANGGDFDWEDYATINEAYEAARAELNGGDVPAKQERKTVTKSSDDITPAQRVKRDGKAAAKAYALAILALV